MIVFDKTSTDKYYRKSLHKKKYLYSRFAELVTLLVGANSQKLTFKNKKIVDTPLHTAVELGSLEAVSVLVGAGMPVNWLNRAGMTPLHICVKKKLKEHLQVNKQITKNYAQLACLFII